MRVIFRTRADHAQGMGDIWGSLAIADAWSGSAEAMLMLCAGDDQAADVLTRGGHRFEMVRSADEERRLLEEFRPDVAVINQLQSPPALITLYQAHARLVVTIDDVGEGAALADLRINVLYQTPGAVTDCSYIMLRREFAVLRERAKPIRDAVRELLITQGGADTYGFTPRIVEAIGRLSVIPHGTVVVGPAFRHDRELEQAVGASSVPLSVIRNARDMADLMWAADLAITAGGLTMFELACVGTPSLVVCGERFEVESAERLERAGAGRCLGFGGDLEAGRLSGAVEALARDPASRQAMSDRGKQLIDGHGAQRIVQLITEALASTAGRHA